MKFLDLENSERSGKVNVDCHPWTAPQGLGPAPVLRLLQSSSTMASLLISSASYPFYSPPPLSQPMAPCGWLVAALSASILASHVTLSGQTYALTSYVPYPCCRPSPPPQPMAPCGCLAAQPTLAAWRCGAPAAAFGVSRVSIACSCIGDNVFLLSHATGLVLEAFSQCHLGIWSTSRGIRGE